MKPIQDLTQNAPKNNLLWLFAGLALLLFVVGFLIFDIDHLGDFLRLWAIPLVLSGFGYGFTVGSHCYKTNNLKLLKQTIIWLYLKFTGRLAYGVVLNSTVAFSAGTIPMFLIRKQCVSLKENISNQVTIPYFVLSILATLCYLLSQGKGNEILSFFQAKIIIIFCFFFIFSFGLFIEQGKIARRLYTLYQLKKFIKKTMASTTSSSLYSDESLLSWVKNTVSYAYQVKEQKIPDNLFFAVGGSAEKNYQIDCYGYTDITSGLGDKLYKIHEGKITRYTPNPDPREGGCYDIVTVDTIEEFISYTKKEITTIPSKYIKEAIATLEKTSDIQVTIPILHWQIYWAEHHHWS